MGKVKLSGRAQNAVLATTGVGGAKVNAEKELTVKDNMLGRVKNKGAAPVKRTTGWKYNLYATISIRAFHSGKTFLFGGSW